MQETGVPLPDGVAVTVTVSPFVPPGTSIRGVESDVRLSVDDDPVSEAAAISGALGALGVTESTEIGKVVGEVETFPATSVRFALRFHVPSAKVPRSQLVAWPTTNVHETDAPPPDGVAIMVIVSPGAPPLALTVGVLSFVLLSVLEAPVSDACARSTPVGAEGAVVSTVIDNAVDAVDLLPAGSVSVALTFQVPSVKVGNVQFDAGNTYEHDTVVLPFVAVKVMVSPVEPPLALTVGVLSFVLLSVLEAPVSDALARSRPLGTGGAPESTEIGKVVGEVETFPATSVRFALRFHVPSANVPRSQLVAWPTTNVHETDAPPPDGVAIMVIVSPGAPPLAPTVGVLSLELLSELLLPVSDALARSRPLGTAGAPESMVTASPVITAVLPDGSVMVAAMFHEPSARRPRVQFVLAPTV